MKRLTATRLADYARCGFLYRAKHVAGIPMRYLQRSRAFGILVHRLTQLDDEYATGAGRRAATEAILRRFESDEARERARRLLDGHRALRSGRPVVMNEPRGLSARLRDRLVDVRPDRVERDVAGLVVVDLKSTPIDEEDVAHERVKIATATLMLWQRDHGRVVGWEICELPAGRRHVLSPVLDPEACSRELSHLLDGILSGSFEPRPGAFCGRCPARRFCPAVAAKPAPLPRVPGAIPRASAPPGPSLFPMPTARPEQP